jgi:hypothetical protein
MNFWAAKNAPRFSILFLSGVVSWVVGCPENSIFWCVLGFDFDSEQIRFLGGHPFVCGWRSYYQQGFKQT